MISPIEEMEQLQSKISDLEKPWRDAQDKQLAAEMEAVRLRKKLVEKRSAPQLKRKGTILIIIGLLLIVLEIMMLTETLIVGYSDFSFGGLVIIGLFLVPGIKRKVDGTREYHRIMWDGKSSEDIERMIATAQAEINQHKEVTAAAQKKAEAAVYEVRVELSSLVKTSLDQYVDNVTNYVEFERICGVAIKEEHGKYKWLHDKWDEIARDIKRVANTYNIDNLVAHQSLDQISDVVQHKMSYVFSPSSLSQTTYRQLMQKAKEKAIQDWQACNASLKNIDDMLNTMFKK